MNRTIELMIFSKQEPKNWKIGGINVENQKNKKAKSI